MSDTFYVDYKGLSVPSDVSQLMQHNSDAFFSTFYQKRRSTLLNELCERYGTDKGEIKRDGHPYPWPSHSYADFMERLFSHCRSFIKAVFECGLGTNNPALASSMGADGKPGASLRVWRDYFPSALIVGADIDQSILFQEERITTFYLDQTDAQSVEDMWRQCEVREFDLMIDDGLHTFDAGRTLLENSIHKLKDGGVYIIEDVTIEHIIEYKRYLDGFDVSYDIVNLYRKGLPLHDNSLIVIRR